MKEIEYHKNFLKHAKKHRDDLSQKVLDDCIKKKTAKGERLDIKYKDHKIDKWKGYNNVREFHPSFRMVVCYLIKNDKLYILDVGTHKELNIAESLK